MRDQMLDFLVIVLPTLISLVGVLFTLEPLNKQHRWKWRTGLVLLGLVVSGLTYVQQARQRNKADAETRALQEHMIAQELKIGILTNDLNAFAATSLRQQKMGHSGVSVKVPSADEIAAALGKSLNVPSQAPTPTPLPTPPPQVRPTPAPAEARETPKPCREDRLSDCTDKQLEEWGKPLIEKIAAIEDRYMADLKQLDDIKEGNWFREIVGIGDKNARWLKAYAAAQDRLAEDFRNCCAEDALAYYKELAHRAGSGFDKAELYDWMTSLMKPVKSKEYKKAKEDASKIIYVLGDLRTLQIEVHIAPAMRSLRSGR